VKRLTDAELFRLVASPPTFSRRSPMSKQTSSRPAIESLEGRSLMSATLFCADQSGELFKLNPTTGSKSLIGRMPVVMYDIAFNKSGQLYGVDPSSALYRINSSTAQVTRIGSVGGFVNGLTFAPDGKLYGSGYNHLYTINTSTGHGTLFGNFSRDINSSGDLAFDDRGNLYFSTTADKLIRINLSSRSYTTVGSIGFHEVYGLAFMNGKLYGASNYTSQVFEINTTTGHGSQAHYFGRDVAGICGAAVKIF
jgi:outer membrane protein assembly factor BamB